MIRILVVCLGNICRSPIAESVLHTLVEERRLGATVEIDSAGTHAGHLGSKPDSRAIAVATSRGYGQIARQRARQVRPLDFERFDLILAMDQRNLHALEQMCPSEHLHKLQLFLKYGGSGGGASAGEVPDPYYGNREGFEHVLELCVSGARAVLDRAVSERFQAR